MSMYDYMLNLENRLRLCRTIYELHFKRYWRLKIINNLLFYYIYKSTYCNQYLLNSKIGIYDYLLNQKNHLHIFIIFYELYFNIYECLRLPIFCDFTIFVKLFIVINIGVIPETRICMTIYWTRRIVCTYVEYCRSSDLKHWCLKIVNILWFYFVHYFSSSILT